MKASLRLMIGTLSGMSYVAPSVPAKFYAKKFITPQRRPRPEAEVEILATATESGAFEGNAFWAWGQGPTILLAHGWQGRGAQLGAFVKPLVAEGFRVVAWDAPAHGESKAKQTTLIQIGEALGKFAKSQPNLHGIVAHSFGGPASMVAIQEGVRVNKIVLVASPSSVQRVFDRFTKITKLSSRSARAFQNEVEAFAGRRVKEVDVPGLKGRADLPEALIFHSDDDLDVPFTEAAGWQAVLPRTQVVPLQKLGHRKILKHPELVAAAVNFLKN